MRIRAARPDIALSTDIIVGFPGETDADFEETLDLVRQVRFAKIHMFPYSPRKRTRAALYPNQVPQEIVRKRKQELLHLAEKTAFELRDRFIGRTMSVLLENKESLKPGYMTGHTPNFLSVLVSTSEYKPNDLINVELIGNEPCGLIGKIV